MLADPKREAEIEFEIKVAKEPWRKVWLDAAQLLRDEGHCRGTLINAYGERCALGAIYGVDPDPDRVGSAASQASILLGHHVGMPVAIWNDHSSTETVIATLELLARA